MDNFTRLHNFSFNSSFALFIYSFAEQIKLRPSYEDIVCQKYRFKLEVLASSIFIKNFNRDLFKFVI